MAIKDNFIKRCLYFISGLLLIALGISITILANLGCCGWDATNISLVTHFGLSVGIWLNIWAILYLIISSLLSKQRIRFECLITSFIIGISVDGFNLLLQSITIHGNSFKFITLVIGVFTIALGAGFYLVSELPPNPIDLMMMCIKEHFHLSISMTKTIIETTGVLLAVLLGGPIGLGTIIMVLLMGPCIDLCFHFANKLFQN